MAVAVGVVVVVVVVVVLLLLLLVVVVEQPVVVEACKVIVEQLTGDKRVVARGMSRDN